MFEAPNKRLSVMEKVSNVESIETDVDYRVHVTYSNGNYKHKVSMSHQDYVDMCKYGRVYAQKAIARSPNSDEPDYFCTDKKYATHVLVPTKGLLYILRAASAVDNCISEA